MPPLGKSKEQFINGEERCQAPPPASFKPGGLASAPCETYAEAGRATLGLDDPR
jgi:hypothetical protein